MADTKTTNQRNRENTELNAAAKTDSTVEVLYQKMGDRWFAFSLIEDEVFIGSISQAEIEMAQSGKPVRSA